MQKEDNLLELLATAVTGRERKKVNCIVFEESFDAKSFTTKNFLFRNSITFIIIPFSGKWNLVNDYTDYEHSSASFYDLNIVKSYQPFDFRVL